jgi:hypothetical protein
MGCHIPSLLFTFFAGITGLHDAERDCGERDFQLAVGFRDLAYSPRVQKQQGAE